MRTDTENEALVGVLILVRFPLLELGAAEDQHFYFRMSIMIMIFFALVVFTAESRVKVDLWLFK